MTDLQIDAEHRRPLAQRFAEHPLVAMAIAVLLYLFVASLGLALGNFIALADPARAVAQTAINILLLLSIYKLVIVHLGATRRDDLPAHGALADLGRGMAAGIVLFSSVVAAAAVLGVYRIVGRHGFPELLIPLVTTAIAPAFMEELLFRGILFRWLEEWGGNWLALILSSALFGLLHIANPGATWFSTFAVGVDGLMLGGAYMVARNLWMPIGLHLAWNFMQGEIFGVPVSGLPQDGVVEAKLVGPTLLTGGNFGLEGSIIALVVATAAGLFFVGLALRRSGSASF